MYSLRAVLVEMGVLGREFESTLDDLGATDEEIVQLRLAIARAVVSMSRQDIVEDYQPES